MEFMFRQHSLLPSGVDTIGFVDFEHLSKKLEYEEKLTLLHCKKTNTLKNIPLHWRVTVFEQTI